MIDFIWSLLVGFSQVLIVGGFLIVGLKYYEWYDDRYANRKIARWSNKQEYLTIRILFPEDINLPISEMQSFFEDANVIGSSPSKKELYSQGSSFYNIVIDIIANNGQLGYFLTAERSKMDLVTVFFKNVYPDIDLLSCEHPFKSWPKEWWDREGLGGSLRNYKGSEVAPDDSDLHPLRKWQDFYDNNGHLVSDPISLITDTSGEIPENAFLVLQYIFKPHALNYNQKVKEWELDIKKIRKKFIENKDIEKSGNTIQSLTKEEERILQEAQQKMKSKQFKTKLRWLLIYDKRKSSFDADKYKKIISAYYQELSTDVQSLNNTLSTNTDAKYIGGKFGLLDGLIGGWINTIYWSSGERSYRMKRLYKSIVSQSFEMGDSQSCFYLDTQSIASLFHFPQVKEKSKLNKNYYNPQTQPIKAQSVDGKSVVIQQYQPAFYIQQPDGTQVPVSQVQPTSVVSTQPSQSNSDNISFFPSQTPKELNILADPTDAKYQPPEDLPT
ncbi:MAG: hypothetical protein AAGF07_03920 [Patescibacteria group bacterium]